MVERRRNAAIEGRNKEGVSTQVSEKTLLFVNGHEGVGKSHVTKDIEKTAPFVVIDKDVIGNIFTESRVDAVHKKTRDICYEILYELARRYLKAGQNVLLDVPFNHPKDFFPNKAWVDRMQGIADKADARLKVVWCAAPPEVRLDRMKKRQGPQEADRPAEAVLKLAAAEDPLIPFEHLNLSTQDVSDEGIRHRSMELQRFLEISPVSTS